MQEKKVKQKIRPLEIKPEMRVRVLNESELESIQRASLTILEETGIKFYSEKAPRSFVMASRTSQELDLRLDGTKVYYGTDGVGIKTIDLQTREERFSKKSDVAMMALISDYLPCVSFYWPIVSARDVPSSTIPLHELDASFNNTEKHVHIVSCVEGRTAQYCVEMAKAVGGGTKTLIECGESPPGASQQPSCHGLLWLDSE